MFCSWVLFLSTFTLDQCHVISSSLLFCGDQIPDRNSVRAERFLFINGPGKAGQQGPDRAGHIWADEEPEI